MTSVKQILEDPSQYYEKNGEKKDIKVAGWAQSFRDQSSKTLGFLTLNDGSTMSNLQVVLKPADIADEKLRKQMSDSWGGITKGVGVEILGELIKSPGAGQVCELVASSIEVYPHTKYFPVAKAKMPLEVLRDYPHLRHRTNTYGAVFRVRHRLQYALHRFFDQAGFWHVATPILTSNDCEGAGETFVVTTGKELRQLAQDLVDDKPKDENVEVDESGFVVDKKRGFFGARTCLTVSGQLQGEAFAMGLKKIYTFGPTFRAEESNTSRHLAEFWMLEPEVAFIKYRDLRQLAVDMFQTTIRDILQECRPDLEFFDQHYQEGLVEKLKTISTSEVPHLPYTEAIEILEKALADHKVFVLMPSMDEKEIKKRSKKAYPIGQTPVWGMDLGSREERYLCEEHFKSPVVVYDYPASFKSFYMKANGDERDTAQAFDFLVPGVGELMGGSMREDDSEKLKKRCIEKNIRTDKLQWYLDLREFSSVPHGGYGLGFERFILYVTGLSNIRDVIPFPRAVGSIKA